jgi:VWFA-related protein
VVNAKGVFVDDLTRDQFQVFDNGVRRSIEHFAIDTDSPLTIGVLVDVSESQKDQMEEHTQTAATVLDKLFRAGDRALVISVGQEIRLWADLTSDIRAIRRQLAGPPGSLLGEPCARHTSECGSTPLWDAVYDTAKLRLTALEGNKILLALTDGFDSGSLHTWRQATDAVQRADGSLYAIQYPSDFGRNYAPDLYRLISDTGGTLLRPPKGAYGSIAGRIDADFRRRYVLGFRPEKLSGRNRHEVFVDLVQPEADNSGSHPQDIFRGLDRALRVRSLSR